MRTIETARSLKEINDAIKAGFIAVIIKIEPNPELEIRMRLIQNHRTNEITVNDSPPGRRPITSSADEEVICDWPSYYPYNRSLPFAAYLVPSDIEINERVVLNDVIEDHVRGTHNGHPLRLNQCQANWNGSYFKLDWSNTSGTKFVG